MNLPAKFSGKVKKHLGRGRELGFPTANLDLPDNNVEEGVYFGFTTIPFLSGNNSSSPPLILRGGRGALPSLIFIGAAETFGDVEKYIETYILDFEGDLYGSQIEIEIIKKLRENQKFDSRKALIARMKQDEEAARDFFNDVRKAAP